MDEEGGVGGKVPTDYDALKRLAKQGHSIAINILSEIEEMIDDHLNNFFDEVSSSVPPNQMNAVMAQERLNFANFAIRQALSNSKFSEQFRPYPPKVKAELAADLDTTKTSMQKEDEWNREKCWPKSSCQEES